jgi:hypothetical protein
MLSLMRRRLLLLPLAFLALLMPSASGCFPVRIGGGEDPDAVIHALRTENHALQRKVDELDVALQRRLREIDQLQAQPAAVSPLTAGVEPHDLPRVVAVELDRFSGLHDSDGDGRADALRLFVLLRDQKGRFMPGAGAVEAVVTGAREDGAGGQGVELARGVWKPAELDAAYRSGLGGTHYLLMLPLPEGVRSVSGMRVRVVFTPATGRGGGSPLEVEDEVRPMPLRG